MTTQDVAAQLGSSIDSRLGCSTISFRAWTLPGALVDISGQGFGEISLIDGEPRSATVRAGAEGLQTFALSAWEFRPLLEENPTVAVELLKTLSARLRAAEAALDAR